MAAAVVCAALLWCACDALWLARRQSASSLYALLSVPALANATAVRAGYKEGVLRLHPDKNRAEDAPAQFMRFQAGYAVLSDASLRHLYDLTGSTERDDMRRLEQALGDWQRWSGVLLESHPLLSLELAVAVKGVGPVGGGVAAGVGVPAVVVVGHPSTACVGRSAPRPRGLLLRSVAAARRPVPLVAAHAAAAALRPAPSARAAAAVRLPLHAARGRGPGALGRLAAARRPAPAYATATGLASAGRAVAREQEDGGAAAGDGAGHSRDRDRAATSSAAAAAPSGHARGAALNGAMCDWQARSSVRVLIRIARPK